MRNALIVILAVLLFGSPAFSQSTTPTPSNPLSPMQAGLAITAPTVLSVPQYATYAVICASGGNANFTTDKTVVTGSSGMPLLQNQCVGLYGRATLLNFQGIQQAGSVTLLSISYYF